MAREDVELIIKQAREVLSSSRNWITNLSQTAAFLFQVLNDTPNQKVNWCGFYLLLPPAQSKLTLGPFQGKIACTEIPIGKGIVGTCALKKEAILVGDVHAFDGHIACDTSSESELVIPLFTSSLNQMIGVLDVDSVERDHFTEDHLQMLTEIMNILSQSTDWPQII